MNFSQMPLKRKIRRIGFRIIRWSKLPFILPDWFSFAKKLSDRFPMRLADAYPCIGDKTAGTKFERHYVYHTAWAARVVKEINPKFHTDISSSLYFCGVASAFVPIKFYDYRPAALHLSGLESEHADLMHLPFGNKSINSISCMHTLEHIGLGRYGDPIDPDGDIKAIKELKRVTAQDGNLLLVMPVGKPRIEYNAHRIYSYEMVKKIVCDEEFYIHEYTYIPQFEEEGPMVRNADPKSGDSASYACGCFWIKRRTQPL
ncbi:MAG TPA: DUF268 domain-containing protein [Candidatus Paceibacterota bacterium]|nr:DUF268 domain-containing protein [Candidatus Paceibacterota bacterium]